MKSKALALIAVATLGTAMVTTTCAGTIVNANANTATDLGLFGAGTYQITGSGVIDLVGDGSFPINPDGTPSPYVSTPNYSYFNPNGSVSADGNYGPGGATIKIGALMGKIDAGAFFTIGYLTTVTLSSPSEIYAQVNDTYYPNNTGSFDVTVSAVPEGGATLATLGLGLATLGALRRKFAA